MDLIVPIGIVIYILVSVIAAVLKSLSSEGPVLGEPMAEKGKGAEPTTYGPVVLEELAEAPPPVEQDAEDAVETVFVSEESVEIDQPELVSADQEMTDEWEDEEPPSRPRPKATKVGDDPGVFSEAAPALTSKELARGVILSEILRPPRAKRRWPH